MDINLVSMVVVIIDLIMATIKVIRDPHLDLISVDLVESVDHQQLIQNQNMNWAVGEVDQDTQRLVVHQV